MRASAMHVGHLGRDHKLGSRKDAECHANRSSALLISIFDDYKSDLYGVTRGERGLVRQPRQLVSSLSAASRHVPDRSETKGRANGTAQSRLPEPQHVTERSIIPSVRLLRRVPHPSLRYTDILWTRPHPPPSDTLCIPQWHTAAISPSYVRI